jgi:hypothetical protein
MCKFKINTVRFIYIIWYVKYYYFIIIINYVDLISRDVIQLIQKFLSSYGISWFIAVLTRELEPVHYYYYYFKDCDYNYKCIVLYYAGYIKWINIINNYWNIMIMDFCVFVERSLLENSIRISFYSFVSGS